MDQCKSKYLAFFRAYWDLYELPTKSDKAMVIVEPRQHPDLEFVIKNTTYFCPGWSLYVFISSNNLDYVRDILGHNQSRAHIVIFTESNITIDDYNRLLVNRAFWDAIDAETILTFQTDTIIRRFVQDKYTHYDFIGAPWPHLSNRIGNGGLSIRRKTALLEAIANLKPEPGEHEDIFFARWNYRPGSQAALPSFEEALEFSVENVFHPNPFGLHQIWKWEKYPALISTLCQFQLLRL